MPRTWICAASAMALATLVASGWTAAQEQQAESSNTGDNRTGQGSASAPRQSGRNVQAMGATQISDESASRIADALMATAGPQNFNVDVSVDGLLPGELDLRPLPPAVVELIPEYRGFEYVVASDQVFIVQPSTRRVVEIIREGGPHADDGRPAKDQSD